MIDFHIPSEFIQGGNLFVAHRWVGQPTIHKFRDIHGIVQLIGVQHMGNGQGIVPFRVVGHMHVRVAIGFPPHWHCFIGHVGGNDGTVPIPRAQVQRPQFSHGRDGVRQQIQRSIASGLFLIFLKLGGERKENIKINNISKTIPNQNTPHTALLFNTYHFTDTIEPPHKQHMV